MHSFAPIETLPFIERVYRFDEINSTNTFALALSESPRDGLYVVVARRQSDGRGQRGNTFHSESDSGLWTSLVVPVADIQSHFGINRCLAMAACDAVYALSGVSCAIKWPNDIFAGGRKLGGILLESVLTSPARIIAGLGINVNTRAEDFASDIASIAVSMRVLGGGVYDTEELLRSVLIRFDELRREPAVQSHARYAGMLLGAGANVRIGESCGEFRGVDDDGRAILSIGGEMRYFTSGPLRIV